MQRLETDVMARLGEIARPQSRLAGTSALDGVPWPEDVVAVKVGSLLGDVGSGLIREASLESLGSGGSGSDDYVVGMREMACGLYGAEIRLPGNFLRVVSVRMAGWRGSVCEVAAAGSPEWIRQWSAEPGIAGCPDRPRAYFDSDGEGMLLRALGSESADDVLGWLRIWTVPEAGENGEFDFPEALYWELVGEISRNVWRSDSL